MDPVEPASWLRLERYHLGELSEQEKALVERALATSSETRACLDEIRKPVTLRPLPELPSRARRASVVGLLLSRWPLLSFATAAVAGAALFVWVKARPVELVAPSHSVRVKGGDIVVGLVRERAGAIDEAPATFVEGDRFKVLLTCPPDFDGSFDVVVLQDGAASFPFRSPPDVACGNTVPLPGAFTLNGTTPATVCVTWARGADERRTIEQRGIGAVRDSVACLTISPE